MRHSNKAFTKVEVVMLGLLLLVFVAAGYLFINGGVNDANNTNSSGTSLEDRRAEAIRQAEEYEPDGICTTALVDAVHTETGAEYTFPSGCLAPGWEAKQ